MSDNNVKFARGGAELTVELLDKLKASTDKKNVLISPFSIQTCMALAFAGAKGETADEIASAMKFTSNNPSEVAETFRFVLEKYQDSKLLKIANKVYIQEGTAIKPEYAAVTKEHYQAGAESVNFADNQAAAQNINSWVENKTAGKITELIPASALNADTRLVLLNALHFKGEWKEKFDVAKTVEDDFWLSEKESVKAKFMHRSSAEFRFGFISDYECDALEMPYKDSDLSMFVLKPWKRDGLPQLVEKLKGANLLDLDEKLRMVDDMMVRFPKFKIDYSVELSDVMKEMGIEAAFGTADFSNMVESSKGLYVSEIFHQTAIEVNEEGCEAVAATGLIARGRCMPPQFIANHAFLYFIWNKKNILFAGAFVNPPVEA